MKENYMIPVQIRLTHTHLDFLDTLIKKGVTPNRSNYIRMLLMVDMIKLKEKL